MDNYNFRDIEEKWQKRWEEAGVFHAESKSKKAKYYCLIEFPYPSGEGLHVGHPRGYTAMDIIARKRRMEGYNVLYPIGWDAFGLPAENYAIKTGVHPSITTKKNADIFRRQMKRLGLSFDWSREINTTDPEYYKWTQWMFLQFVKHDMAYKAKAAINWCPKDKTGLANEEVVNGCCERCGTPVEKREKEQWMIRITKYADRLIDDLDKVDYLPQIKEQQKNWIGRSEGATIQFPISNFQFPIEVFTTRPDTIFGATFLVISPELAKKWMEVGWQATAEVRAYVEAALKREEMERMAEGKEKTGVATGLMAVNPASGEDIPVWVADYVLGGYGTGAIMAVPAHDERDFEFAKKFGLPIREVIEPMIECQSGELAFRPADPIKEREVVHCVIKHPTKDAYLLLKWKEHPWITVVMGGIEKGEDAVEAAVREIREETGYKNLRFVRRLGGKIHCKFFAPHKKENRLNHVQGLLFELTDEEKEEVSGDEAGKHELSWVERKKVWETLAPRFQDGLVWQRYDSGNDIILFSGDGPLVNSGKFDGVQSSLAAQKITQWLEKEGKGKKTVQYKLHDWVFSRQRYWGEPIPIMYCRTCWETLNSKPETLNKTLKEGIDYVVMNGEKYAIISVPEKDLPVELPKVEKYQPTDNGESPLSAVTEWVNVSCPKCGGTAKRETDTMPNWAGSSWYFLRYCDPDNNKEFASRESLLYWMGAPMVIASGAKQSREIATSPVVPRNDENRGGGVDWYNGGMEHTTLHLLYSRFWHKFLFDIGVIPKECGDEPYQKRTSHGLILGEGGEKMSKSRGNVVNPDEVVEKFGADAFRLYEMFMGPFDQPIPWDTNGLMGCKRFLEKVWKLQERMTNDKLRMTNDAITRLTHKTLKKVSEHIEEMRFNTAVSAMMILVNEMEKKAESVAVEDYGMLLSMLSPFAPHIAEELNEQRCQVSGVRCQVLATQPWPKWDPKLVIDDEINLVVQVNGKVRDTVRVAADIDEAGARVAALASLKTQKFLEGKDVKKMIFVKGRLINLII